MADAGPLQCRHTAHGAPESAGQAGGAVIVTARTLVGCDAPSRLLACAIVLAGCSTPSEQKPQNAQQQAAGDGR